MARKKTKQPSPRRVVHVMDAEAFSRAISAPEPFVPQALGLDVLETLTLEYVRCGHVGLAAVEAADRTYRRLDALTTTYLAARQTAQVAGGRPR